MIVTRISFVFARDEDLRGVLWTTPQTDSALGQLVRVYGQPCAKVMGSPNRATFDPRLPNRSGTARFIRPDT